MNIYKIQIGGLAGLAHMNSSGGLETQLKAFLLSCKVDELSPRTLTDYQQKIGAFIRFCSTQGINQPEKVTVNHARLFLVSLQERCAAYSIHDYYGCIKRFFNWLVAEGVLERNPMASMRSPRVPRKLIKPFSAGQIKDLLSWCDNNTFIGARNKAIVLTFLDTGLRLSEMASVQLKDVNFDREIIQVMGKGARERIVGIGKNAQKALLRYLLMRHDKHSCLWVTEERRPMKAEGIQTMIKRLGKRAGLVGVRCSPHTFRHTFGTMALLHGAGEFAVQSLLGHSTLTMTRRYAATLDSESAASKHRGFSPADHLND